MVCVDDDPFNTSKKYIYELGLEGVIMGYCVGKKDFPPFPAQLGCQGLIIFDNNGRLVLNRSPALNQVGVDAFKNVDAVVTTLLKDSGDDCYNDDKNLRLYCTLDEIRNDISVLQAGAKRRVASKLNSSVSMDKSRIDATCAEKCTKCMVTPEQRYNYHVEQILNSSRHEQVMAGLVPSVGHAKMDDEHEACSAALQHLESEKSLEALEAVIKILTEHFSHEIQLLEEVGFGKNQLLSPLVSHITDHDKIIDSAKDQLKKAKLAQGKIQDEYPKILMNLFFIHAIDFDSRYECVLNSSG